MQIQRGNGKTEVQELEKELNGYFEQNCYDVAPEEAVRALCLHYPSGKKLRKVYVERSLKGDGKKKPALDSRVLKPAPATLVETGPEGVRRHLHFLCFLCIVLVSFHYRRPAWCERCCQRLQRPPSV